MESNTARKHQLPTLDPISFIGGRPRYPWFQGVPDSVQMEPAIHVTSPDFHFQVELRLAEGEFKTHGRRVELRTIADLDVEADWSAELVTSDDKTRCLLSWTGRGFPATRAVRLNVELPGFGGTHLFFAVVYPFAHRVRDDRAKVPDPQPAQMVLSFGQGQWSFVDSDISPLLPTHVQIQPAFRIAKHSTLAVEIDLTGSCKFATPKSGSDQVPVSLFDSLAAAPNLRPVEILDPQTRLRALVIWKSGSERLPPHLFSFNLGLEGGDHGLDPTVVEDPFFPPEPVPPPEDDPD